MHGYALRDGMEGSGLLPEVDGGHGHRTLRPIEASGLVSSPWECDSAARGRRQDAITDAGVRSLEAAERGLGMARDRLALFFAMYRARVEQGADAAGPNGL